jgi:hypothetical protein
LNLSNVSRKGARRETNGWWLEINTQSTKRPSAIRTDGNSALDVWYALKFECFSTGALTSLGIPRADVDMAGLSTNYDSSVSTNIDILQNVRHYDI